MGNVITAQVVEHIAKLARLKLSAEEKQLYAEQMQNIIGYFDELASIDTTNIEPMSHALSMLNVMREDVIKDPIGHELLLRTAPDREGSFFRVPKIDGK